MSNVELPFFSVIIPLYNKEAYIGRAVHSVLAQSFQNFEVVIVNDGSTDNGFYRVKQITDPRVKLYDQNNQGVAHARNAGVEYSIGRWKAFLDADDLWGAEHLSELKRIISAFPYAGIVCTTSQQVIENCDISFLEKSHKGNIEEIRYFDQAANDIGVVHTSSVSVASYVFDEIGGFGYFKLGQDLEFWARVALKYSVVKSTRTTVIYYRGNGGAMETYGATAKGSTTMPRRLSDLSPSVSTLAQRLPWLEKEPEIHSSVVRYINSRVTQALRGAFIRGDIRRMKALNKLYIAGGDGPSKVWRYISAFPEPLIMIMAWARNSAKNIYYMVKR